MQGHYTKWRTKVTRWTILIVCALLLSFSNNLSPVDSAFADTTTPVVASSATEHMSTSILVFQGTEPPTCGPSTDGQIWTDPITGYRFKCSLTARGWRWIYYDDGGCQVMPDEAVKPNC